MTNHELDTIKHQIDCKITNIIKELKIKKERDKYFVTEEEFQKLKFNLYFELNINTEDGIYDYYYHMEPVNNFSINEYNIVLNIMKNYELITKYIIPFTIVINISVKSKNLTKAKQKHNLK